MKISLPLQPPSGSRQSVIRSPVIASAVGRVAIRSFFKGRRILSRYALRMTSWLVPANVTGCALNCRSVIAKPCKRLWQSVSPLRVLRILSRYALRMTNRLVVATAVKCAAIRSPKKRKIVLFFSC